MSYNKGNGFAKKQVSFIDCSPSLLLLNCMLKINLKKQNWDQSLIDFLTCCIQLKAEPMLSEMLLMFRSLVELHMRESINRRV